MSLNPNQSRSPAQPRGSPGVVQSRSPGRSPQPGSATKNVASPAPAITVSSPRPAGDMDVAVDLLKQGMSDAISKSYTVEEDLKIHTLFKDKAPHKQDKLFEVQKKELSNQLKRSIESIRDRYKKYLKFLTEADLKNIEKTVGDHANQYYLNFEKVSDSQDGAKKQLKKISKEEPRPAAPKIKAPGTHKKKSGIFPGGTAARGSTSAKHTTPGGLPSFTTKRKGVHADFADSEYLNQLGRKQVLREYMQEDDDWEKPFNAVDYCPPEYFAAENHISLNEAVLSIAVKQEIRSFNEVLLSFGDQIQVTYNGDDFNFEFVKKAPIKEMYRLLQNVSQLLGVPVEDAERIYEQCSHDIDDLKAYIGGNKKLAWTSVEDHALVTAFKDKKQFDRFYPHLVKDKGEESVRKRIDYLKSKKILT